MKKDSRNEEVKKRDEDGENKELYIYIYMRKCMREVLDEDVVAACEEMGLWVSRGQSLVAVLGIQARVQRVSARERG